MVPTTAPEAKDTVGVGVTLAHWLATSEGHGQSRPFQDPEGLGQWSFGMPVAAGLPVYFGHVQLWPGVPGLGTAAPDATRAAKTRSNGMTGERISSMVEG